jgi:PPOX class probable F420-dependent enzyme
MTAMPAEARALLTSGALAHLVTVNRDGSPQVTCVWVGLEGDDVVIATLVRRQKVRNVERDPRVALSVASPRTNRIGLQEYLVIYGRARVQPGGAPELLRSLAQVYLGPGSLVPDDARPATRLRPPYRRRAAWRRRAVDGRVGLMRTNSSSGVPQRVAPWSVAGVSGRRSGWRGMGNEPVPLPFAGCLAARVYPAGAGALPARRSRRRGPHHALTATSGRQQVYKSPHALVRGNSGVRPLVSI